jgi:uncharacterized protein YPO0396
MNDPERASIASASDELPNGFRLHRLEVLNWGTFDGRIWALRLDGQNALLTGDIGSGKSTLVDAMTTLLVPAYRVAYNRAAGAEARERTLRSYVLGHYKSERSDAGASAKPVPLRDNRSFSVILAVFRDSVHQLTVSLAQVFWITDRQPQPERLYVCAERELSISNNFANFNAEIARFKKRLRESGTEVFDSFPAYGAWFRRRMGIENEQAMDLFHQAVSMKSVDNLTGFVRAHMLEPFDVEPRIKALIEHFDDLHRAHDSVLKAKRQIELLTPLVGDCDRHAELDREIVELRSYREALQAHFAALKAQLLDKRIAAWSADLERQKAHFKRIEERCSTLRGEESELRRSIAENGGDRIERLEHEIRQNMAEQERRKEKAARYDGLARSIAMKRVSYEQGFLSQQQEISTSIETAQNRQAELQNIVTAGGVDLHRRRQEHQILVDEIASLKARNSNIDPAQVKMRAELCAALELREQELPFAGELLQVRPAERAWEGATERVLRGFGLSLLVHEDHYARVAEWVEKTHLKGRLVYYRVRPNLAPERSNLQAGSLVQKLEIKRDSQFYNWMERELAQRFDYTCAIDMEQFRRESRAITRAGQIKGRGERHEKDDRYRLDDRARYVLGWTNDAKIAALDAKRRQLESEIAERGSALAKLQTEQRQIDERLSTLSRLSEYRDFRDIDWGSLAVEAERLRAEKERLQSASDKLSLLGLQLDEVVARLREAVAERDEQHSKLSRTEQKIEDAERHRSQAQALLQPHDDEFNAFSHERIARLREEVLPNHQTTVESCENDERAVRNHLQVGIDAEDKQIARLRDRIIKAMSAYKDEFKLESSEVDASMEASAEYRGFLASLQADDLPRFEAKFKELLNENTIREIANFQSQLHRERETIKDRIARINQSLTHIDYNPARYIALEAQNSGDVDVRDFRAELRSCTEGSLTGSDQMQYSEAKFLQVRKIVERFRGRQGTAEPDRQWTTRVTDVRNWFVFAASERWREDNSEFDHSSDSDGKSGGQKEKLAYTILAASLTYQFGLERGSGRARSFRFVMLDEAFARGSELSAHYALKLFSELKLQLLVATPLQKIHVIEPFVRSVGFVQNEDGRSSKLRNLSIEEYRAEKARHDLDAAMDRQAEERIEAMHLGD